MTDSKQKTRPPHRQRRNNPHPLHTLCSVPHAVPRAFTLVEMIMAIVILAIAVTGIFTLIIVTINLNAENLLKVQALELSREALEGARSVRDTSWKNNQKFVSYREGGTWKPLPDEFTIEPNLDNADDEVWIIKSIGAVSDPPTVPQRASIRLNYFGEDAPPPSTKLNVKAILHTSGAFPRSQPSPFYRYVKIEQLNEPGANFDKDEALKVTVVVYYDFNGKFRKSETTEVLTDWRKV